MTSTRYYVFEFSDGYSRMMTNYEALIYVKDNKVDILYRGGVKYGIKYNRKRTRDGFKPGYNPALGEYVGGPREFQRKLKEKGLVEMGNEYKSTKFEKEIEYVDDAMKKDLVGAGMSEREADSLS